MHEHRRFACCFLIGTTGSTDIDLDYSLVGSRAARVLDTEVVGALLRILVVRAVVHTG